MKTWCFHERKRKNEFDTHYLPAFFFQGKSGLGTDGKCSDWSRGVFFFWWALFFLQSMLSFLGFETVHTAEYRSTYKMKPNYAMHVYPCRPSSSHRPHCESGPSFSMIMLVKVCNDGRHISKLSLSIVLTLVIGICTANGPSNRPHCLSSLHRSRCCIVA